MPPTLKRATLSDVATHAGVSKATVSAVLNASAAVRAATRERVLAAAEVLDYRLPAVGGAAAGRRATRALGLVIKEDDNPYYAGLVAGVRAVADAHGYVLLVASSEGDVRAERRAVELLQAKDVDGLLLTPVLGDEAEADLSPLFDLKRRGVPFVLLESVRGVPASLVDVDNVRASCAAAEHLVALGHTRLAHFAGPAYSTHTHERVQGVRHAASASAAVFTDAHVVTAGAHLEDGYRAALAYFGGLPAAERPTGVTCYNDLIALGVCRALRELGLRVPEDVSVVGFDDIPLLEYLNVPLTSVRVPVAEMGARAAELLVAQLGGAGHGAPPTPPERHLVRAELVVRASTAPPPACMPPDAALPRRALTLHPLTPLSPRPTLTEACRVTQPPRRMRRTPSAPRPLALALALAALPGALLVTVPLHTAAAQQPAVGTGRVAGTVLGEGNRPVPGAQVVVVGTRVGAVTDDNGRYNIAGVPTGAQTVRVQRIGFAPRTQTVSVSAGQVATLDFALTAAVTELTAVAVVGYTQETRREISGAVTSVRADELRDQKVATIEEALRGRAPGVQIAASGQPGRPAQIIIRGQNGFNSPNPLYVVDGTYVGQQNPNINPDDVASIEILKDASAAAQYGAQASNGVVVITTRRGQAGQNQFSFNTYAGVQQVPKRLDLANTAKFLDVFRQAYANAGVTGNGVPAVIRNGSAVSTDWQDAVFRTGRIQNYNLSASGGTPTASYLLSGSVFDNEGTIYNTGFRRYSLRVNSQASRGRVTVGENIALSQANARDFANGIFGGAALPLIDVAGIPPTIPVRNANNPGGYGYGSDSLPNYSVNPVAVLEQNYNRRRANAVIGSAFGEVRLVGNLRYRLNLGLNYADSLTRVWTSGTQLRYLTPLLTGASLQQSAPNVQQLLYENLLSYDGGFGAGLHRVSAVAGQTSQRNDYTTISGFRTNFTNEQLQQLNAGGASAAGLPGGFTVPFRTNSVLARATYAFRDRYLVTGSARRDCSTRFSAGNRCGTFGAGSLGWVVSEEPFFKPIPGVGGSFFKVRASTGVLGDQNIGDLAYVAPIAQNQNYVVQGPGGATLVSGGATQIRVANTNLRWQRNRSTNVGFDLGVMDNALTFTADYYVSKADQVLVSLPVPNSLGSVGDPVFNAGSVRNAGFELGATHRMERGALKLNNTLTLTTTSNRVTSLGGANGAPIRRGPEEVARTDVGQPIGSFFVIRTAGLFQSDADVQAHKNSKGVVIQPNAKAGDLRFVDANGDGTINNDDRQFTGSPIPKLTSGLFMNASYGSFGAGLNLRGAFGNKIYNAVRLQTDRVTGVSNVRADYNPWTPTNTNTSTPRAVFGDAVNGNPATDRWLEDGDFVRIQNVELSYTLPQRLYQRARLGLANAPRVFVNAQNLYTFTRYSGYDPEVLGFGDPLARGIDDGFIYPNPRQFTLGFDVRF